MPRTTSAARNEGLRYIGHGALLVLGFLFCWARFDPDAPGQIRLAITVLTAGVALVLLVLLAGRLLDRKRHREWLWSRVGHARRILQERPEDGDRREELYQSLRELNRPRELLMELEAWAAADPDDLTVRRRLHEVRVRLGVMGDGRGAI